MSIADYHRLTPVLGDMRVGLVSFDPTNSDHLRLFRSRGVNLYQRLAKRHGAQFYPENIENIIRAASQSEINLRFVVVAKKLCKSVFAGIMTSVRTYNVQWDEDGNRYVTPFEHGEDLVLSEKISKWFRKATKTKVNPKGESLGSFAVREQINQAVNHPIFKSSGKDNEHSLTNEAIKGVMQNNGAVIGTKEDSLVFLVRPDEVEINDSFGLKIDIEYPHAQGNFFERDKNSIIAHYVGEDSKQQISMVFTKIPATSDPEPVVWTRVTSNGNLPDGKTLDLILLSLLKAGINEIEKPERLWMIPPGHENSPEFFKAFGGVSPNLHLHIFKKRPLVEAMKKIGLQRFFGDELMISGQINYTGAIIADGKETFEPTIVECTGEKAIDDPIFDFELQPTHVISRNHSPSRSNILLSNKNTALNS